MSFWEKIMNNVHEKLFKEIKRHYHNAQNDENDTRCAVKSFRLRFVGENRGDSRPQKRERHAQT